MTDQHPITPPPELVQQWIKDWTKMVHQWALVKDDKDAEKPLGPSEYAATQAARWGADQELEACCEYLTHCAAWEPEDVKEFCDLRRPKPLSLRTALQELVEEVSDVNGYIPPGVLRAIKNARRALEALPDD